MRAATEGNLPPVMPQGNLIEVLGREVRQGSPGKLMVESSPSPQRQPPCKTNKEISDEAADAAALTYLPYLPTRVRCVRCPGPLRAWSPVCVLGVLCVQCPWRLAARSPVCAPGVWEGYE